jgi:hypothetical protein
MPHNKSALKTYQRPNHACGSMYVSCMEVFDSKGKHSQFELYSYIKLLYSSHIQCFITITDW